MKLFLPTFASLIFVFCSHFSFGQNFKTEVRMLDSTNASIKAGLFITQTNKADFDMLLVKTKNQNLFIIEEEFIAEKNTARIYLKSNSKLTLKDFELFLKQLEIYTVAYKNQEISSQDLANKYSHYKSDEIKKIDRIK